eukprot:scaffold388_cov380-Prasinococcus_capsulatus_cf.AAC.4
MLRLLPHKCRELQQYLVEDAHAEAAEAERRQSLQSRQHHNTSSRSCGGLPGRASATLITPARSTGLLPGHATLAARVDEQGHTHEDVLQAPTI